MRIHARSARRSPDRRRWAAIALVTTLLAGAFVALTATAADAGAMDVTIAASNATTQRSGSAFTYDISLPCAGTATGADANFCFDSKVTIPLDDGIGMEGWAYSVSGGPAGFVQSTAVDPVAHELVITLVSPISAGTAQNISLSVTPPNLTTPDGTTWSLLPTVTSEDSTGTTTQSRTAPTPATGTATATVPLAVAKSSPQSFDYGGDTFSYTITVSCPATKPLGSLDASAITVSDPVPNGLTFVSSSPSIAHYDGATRRVSWSYDDQAAVPQSCGGSAADSTASQTVTVSVDQPVTAALSVSNTVSAAATPVGGSTPDPAVTATRSVTLLPVGGMADPGTTNLTKDSVGQLHESAGSGMHGTYPGPWMPISTPASITDPSAATYILHTRIPSGGYEYSITDDLPCLDDLNGVTYTAATAGVCARPAFHVTSIQLNVGAPLADPTHYPAPTYVLDDGTPGVADFDATHSTPTTLGWSIPAADYGHVARLAFPVDPSQEDRTADDIRINGYADSSTTAGQILSNSADVSLFWQGAATATKTQTSNTADIDILDTAQIGAEKTMTDDGAVTTGRSRVSLAGTLVTPGVPASDLVVADLLPAGSALITAPASITASLGRQRGAAINVSAQLQVQVIDDFSGGRQLLRFTLPVAAFPVEADRYRLAIGAFVVSKPTVPGTYTNAVDVFYDSADLSGVCFAGDHLSDDPTGLRGSATTTAAHCEASATFTSADSVTSQYSIVKTVQGDLDTSPQISPAIGHVQLDSGSAAYQLIWTNTGLPTLDDVVLYDVLPHPGDTGITALQATVQRNSQFTPVLTGVATPPSGVTVEYSSATNPCRDEVYPDAANTGCAPASWTTDPSTIGGLQDVTAIRIASSASYATGDGFTLGFAMGVPSIDRDEVAWNSVAAAADDVATGNSAGVTEAPAVGITGSLHRLGLDKTVDSVAAKPGDRLTYTITASNLGTEASVGTTVRDVLPAGLDFVSADHGGSYDAATRTVTWSLPGLARGADLVLSLAASVGSWQDSAQLVNRASVADPAGYSPTLYSDPCPSGPAASCAPVSVPRSTLAFTGGDVSALVGLLVVGLLAAGLALILVRRRRA